MFFSSSSNHRRVDESVWNCENKKKNFSEFSPFFFVVSLWDKISSIFFFIITIFVIEPEKQKNVTGKKKARKKKVIQPMSARRYREGGEKPWIIVGDCPKRECVTKWNVLY